MQLSSIIPILFILISNVCASPLYIGSSNNDIQAISKLTPRAEKTPLPKTKEELVEIVGPLTISSQDLFVEYWGKRTEYLTGKGGYHSYIYGGDKIATAIPCLDRQLPEAIIKGIWTTRIREENWVTEKAVIDEVFHHKHSGNLLAFGINQSPSGYQYPQDPPDFFVIIKNKNYFTLGELERDGKLTKDQAQNLRKAAKRKLIKEYEPDPGFLSQESFLYEKDSSGKIIAVFI